MQTLIHDWISITSCSGIVQVFALNCVTEAALTTSTVAPNVQSGKSAEMSLPRYCNEIFSYADYSSKRRNHNETNRIARRGSVAGLDGGDRWPELADDQLFHFAYGNGVESSNSSSPDGVDSTRRRETEGAPAHRGRLR